MTNTGNVQFISWLNEKLRQLNTDENVFGSYIVGILEGEETPEEKAEAIGGILGEIISDNIEDIITEITNKWLECHRKNDETPKKSLSLDVDQQLAKLLETQKLQATVVERQYTEEEKRIKEKILAQYSQLEVSDEEGDVDDKVKDAADKPSGTSSNTASGIEKNTNVQDVLQLQKERREQARADSAAKKLKDKEDREKQKQLREEKKEKRKTVKGERRR